LLNIYPELDGAQGDGIRARAEKTSDATKNECPMEILEYLSQNGAAGRVCICTELGLSSPLSKDISGLCDNKELIPTGNGKATRYQVAGPESIPRG